MYTHHCLLAFCPGLSSPFAYSGVVTYSYMQEGIHRYPCKSGYIFIYARGGRYPCKSGYIFIHRRGNMQIGTQYPCKSGYIIIYTREDRYPCKSGYISYIQERIDIHARVVTYSYIQERVDIHARVVTYSYIQERRYAAKGQLQVVQACKNCY